LNKYLAVAKAVTGRARWALGANPRGTSDRFRWSDVSASPDAFHIGQNSASVAGKAALKIMTVRLRKSLLHSLPSS
jgi:hypothetical protein